MRPILSSRVLVLLLAVGCRGGIPIAGHDDPPTREEMERRRSSPFGIEYALPLQRGSAQTPDVAEIYRGLGARWVKFQGVRWEGIEPAPPREGRHEYRFERLDEFVLAWQRAGYHVQVHLQASSAWAGSEGTGPATEGFGWKVMEFFARPPTVPKEEFLDDYEAFVEAVVERYDGDGVADLPGLVAPILDYEIESEVQHLPFWASGVEDYHRMLGIACAAVHRASPSARVLLSGIHVGEFVADDPPDDVLEARFRKATEGLPEAGVELAARVRLFLPRILSFTDRYDAVEFHSLEDTAEAIPGTVRWIRRQMGEGGREKPIWAGTRRARSRRPTRSASPRAAGSRFRTGSGSATRIKTLFFWGAIA
ncbi:MAG: hypothetical protein HY720_14205 [Planctomycetes bacterium]|nr:hypothetical protein [Planctomycetota bacterium]